MHSTQPRYNKLPPQASLQSAWQLLTRQLEAAGIDCARQESRLVLQHATRQTPADFFAALQRPATEEEAIAISSIVARRLHREPLQYILNSAYFYGREYYVDPTVLIPRPETELIIELLADLPGTHGEGTTWIGDIGTGSGAIAVTLACELQQCRIVAVDASSAAVRVARGNAVRHGVSDRVHCICGDLLAPLAAKLDVLVANLPYVPSAECSSLSPEVAQFEPRAALDGGIDGLDVVSRLCTQAAAAVHPGGRLLLEVGINQARPVMDLLRQSGDWEALASNPDLAGIPRVVTARRAGIAVHPRG
mgnify:CR=1 FL=1